MPVFKPIFIVGPMGSGKSYIGEKLGQRCALPFYDLDERIENGEKTTIANLFEMIGESRFRELEAQYLRRVPLDGIVATGGGTPCFNNNMNWINNHGYSIYLDTSLSLLASRLRDQSSHRPLIAHMDEEQLLPYLQNMLNERQFWYRQAHYIYCQNREGLPAEQDIYNSFLTFIK